MSTDTLPSAPPGSKSTSELAELSTRHTPSPPDPVDAGASTDPAAAINPETPVAGGSDTRYIQHYELIRELGRGGMGVVHLARDLRLGRLVAIKMLTRPGHLPERFLAEARATARCRHENIVVIYEVGVHDEQPYLVFEYLRGQTLRQWMDARLLDAFEVQHSPGSSSQMPAPLTPMRAAELMVPVVRALVCAHDMGIIHRDLKPANILLTDEGVTKVLDFGVAKIGAVARDVGIEAAVAPGEPPAITALGARMGTLPYMSPEQLAGEVVDHRSDIWAVGLILYELVTGAHPLAPLSMAQIHLMGDRATPMPSVREHRNDLGPLADTIDRCLLKDREHRTATARDLLQELEAVLPTQRTRARDEESNPFAGLAAFQEADADHFFGRDHDIASMVGKLQSVPLVAVTGPSGAGKSSLIRAGVIPALKRLGEGWEAMVTRPGRQPLATLAEVLLAFSVRSSEVDTARGIPRGPDQVPADRDAIMARLRIEPGYLGIALRTWARAKLRRLVLVVDQFEELYTLGASNEERRRVLACLGSVADDVTSPLRVMLSVRSDFLDRLVEQRAFLDTVSHGLTFLSPLDRGGLREALTRPVEACDHRFESPAMVEQIVAELEATRSPLPLLQFTADKLWARRDRQQRVFTEASLRALGGVSGALASHADAVLASMPGHDARLARAVFRRLVTPERTRSLATLAELRPIGGDAEGMSRVLTRLIEARLLAVGGSAGNAADSNESDGMVELVHESLIDTWPLLGKWLAESEEDAIFLTRLRSAARDWERSGHAAGLLWTGAAAREARVWHQRYQGELTAVEEQYLAAVFAAAERQRRLRRRLLGGAMSATTVVAIVMAYLAWQQGKATSRATEAAAQARQEAVRAEREAMRGRDATRMAVARSLPEDPTTQIALLREIEDTESPPAGTVHELRRLLHADVARLVLTGDEPMTSVAFSPDGSRIVSSSVTRTKYLWDAGGAGVLHTFKDQGTSVIFSADGSRIFSLGHHWRGQIWNADGSGTVPIVQDPNSNSTLAFSADGSRAAFDCESLSSPCVWNTDGSGSRLVLSGGRGAQPIMGTFSRDGALLASACCDEGVHIWNIHNPGPPVILGRGNHLPFSSLAFSPDGARIIVVNREGINVWNTDGSGAPLTLRGHKGEAYSAVFSPDGSRIASASADDTIRIWNAHDATVERILRGHTDEVRSVAFSLDGRRIASASDDMTIRVWNAQGSKESWTLGYTGHDGTLFDLSPDGSRIIIAAFGANEAQILNIDGSGVPIVLRGHSSGIHWVAFSPDGVHVASSWSDKTVRIWRADSPGAPTILRDHEHEAHWVSFSPDGSRVISTSRDNTIHVWKVDAFGEPIILRQPCSWKPIVSSDGTRVACYSRNRSEVWVRNVDGSGEPVILRSRDRDGQIGWSLAFSPDGARIATVIERSSIRIWNADGSGEPIELRDRGAWEPVFSPDGSRIVFASGTTIRIWSADGSGEPLVLSGHQDTVSTVALSLDGSRIVSTSSDGTMRVWRIDGSGEPLVIPAQAGSARFTPDGQRIVAVSEGKVRVWEDLNLPDLHDPRLWTITNYCMPIAARQQLLGMSEESARRDLQRCRERVEQARRTEAMHTEF